MATTQSTQYAAQVAAAADFNSRIDDSRQIDGAVQYARIEVPIAADNVALEVIDLIELPTGAVVLPELSKVLVTDDCTTGALTLDIGDSEDPDRFANGIDCAAVGTVDFTSVISATEPAALHTLYKSTSDTKVIKLTLATFTATIEAGSLVIVLAYKSL